MGEVRDAASREDSRMTWKEFKEFLEKNGVKDSDRIWYIDVTYPTEGNVRVQLESESEYVQSSIGIRVYN